MIDVFSEKMQQADLSAQHRVDQAKIHKTAQKMASQLFAQLLQELSHDQEAIGGFGEELMRPELNRALAEAIVDTPAGDAITGSIERRMLLIQEKSESYEKVRNPSIVDTFDYIEREYLRETQYDAVS